MIEHKKILFDIPVSTVPLQHVPQLVTSYMAQKGKKTFFYINAHCINLAQQDPYYKSILQKADLVYSGGIGPVWASKILGDPIPQRTPTPDFIHEIFQLAQNNDWTVYLLGADSTSIQTAAQNLSKQYPSIIVGFHHGYLNETNTQQVINDINKKKPTILFVGMGSPKQEKWIDKHKKELHVQVFWAVGALFDIISQKRQRPPYWLQQIGLEWFYRLLQEPHRLWKRYLLGNAVFTWRVFKKITFFKK